MVKRYDNWEKRTSRTVDDTASLMMELTLTTIDEHNGEEPLKLVDLYSHVQQSLGLVGWNEWKRVSDSCFKTLRNLEAIEYLGKYGDKRVVPGPGFESLLARYTDFGQRALETRMKNGAAARVNDEVSLAHVAAGVGLTVLVLPADVTALAYKTKSGKTWKGEVK